MIDLCVRALVLVITVGGVALVFEASRERR